MDLSSRPPLLIRRISGLRGLLLLLALLMTPSVCWGQSSTLLVDTNVGEATIRVDGQRMGQTNQKGTALIDTLQAGSYTVELQKAGYWTASSKVQLEPGLTSTVTLNLTARPAEQGRIQLRANVSGAAVLVDGNAVGKTGPDGWIEASGLASGSHKVVVHKDGYQQMTQTVSLDSSNWERTLDVQLAERRTAAAAAPSPDSAAPSASPRQTARLLIDAGRPDALVRLNDSTRGTTDANGLLSTRVTPGQYTISVDKTDFRPTDTTLYLGAGNQRSLSLPITPRDAGSSGTLPLLSQLSAPWLLTGLGLLIGVVGAIVALVNLSRTGADGPLLWPWRRKRFDRYEVHDVIQRSEFSTVYRANDPVEHGPVTLTVLDDPYAADPDHVQPFLDKGQTLRSVHETAPDAPIVDVHRVGRNDDSADGRPFIVFETLDGEALLSHLKNTPTLETAAALSITRQVCTGLKVAHAHDVHHGTLGPENVIVTQDTPEYSIKLVGFGLQSQHNTSHDVGGGGASYRAPEQLLDGRSDRQSDMYSAGMLFYKLVTGAPPYADENPIRVLKNQEEDPKPDLPDHIPTHVHPVFHSMISKDPERRPTASRVISVLDLLESTT